MGHWLFNIELSGFMRYFVRFIVWLVCLTGSAWAQILVVESKQEQVLNKNLRAWIDTSGQASIEEVALLPDSAFAPLAKRRLSPQGPNQAIWVRLDLITEQDRTDWLLSTTQISSDDVRVFSRKTADQPWQMAQAGTQIPVADWPLRKMRPTFSIVLPQGQAQRLYVRVHDVYGSWTGLQISSVKTHLESEEQERLLLGMYLGVSVAVLFLGLANWASSKEGLWLGYAAYNGLMTLAQMSLIGLSGVLFFDRWPRLHEFSIYATIAAAGLTFVLFAVKASQALRFAPMLARASLAYAGFLAAWITMFWFMRAGFVPLESIPLYETVEILRADFIAQAIIPLSLVCGVLIIGLFAITWWRGYSPSGPAVMVVLITLLSSLPQAAYSLDWIERSWLTEHALLLGLMFESIAMLFVMQRHSRSQAHTAGRLRQVSLHDALTGLMPRTGALKKLDGLLARAQKRGIRLDLLYVRLDNLDDITRSHGHEVADSALLVLARYLTEVRQSGDLAARMGFDRFMLIPANTMGVDRSTQELRDIASALVAKGLSEHPLLGHTVKLDIRIWIARLEPEGGSAASILASLQRKADKAALAQSSKRIEVLEQL